MHEYVSVIIPFYQKEKGILSKALRSIFRQKNVEVKEIIVIDDGSPSKALEELDTAGNEDGIKIRIIEQKNAGPAAARNKGLDELDHRTRFVAFLDSDDEWTEDHLSRALSALAQGYDFYFSNYQQLNQNISAFEREQRIELKEHKKLNDENLFYWNKDMFNQILTGNVIATSSVTYRYEKFADIRFREEYVHAGEDYLFWMDFTRHSDKFVFSNNCEVIYGKGINIYSGSGWGTQQHFARLHYELKYRKAILKLFTLSREQKIFVKEKINELRLAITRDLLHRIHTRKKVEIPIFISHFLVDPFWLFHFAAMTVMIAIKKIRR